MLNSKKWFYVIILTFTIAFLFSQSINDLKLYTEQYPPFNFEENGELKGITVDLITKMLETAGSELGKSDIQLLAWARAYNLTLENENTCLFATTRTEDRENKFKWVGPIAPTKISVLALKERKISINSAADLKQYDIGVIRDDVGQQLLEKLDMKKNIQKVADNKLNMRKITNNRIDLWAYEENVAKWQLKSAGYDPNNFETVYTLKKAQLYFALNKNTNEKIVNKLQNSLDTLKENGTYQKILDRYLK